MRCKMCGMTMDKVGTEKFGGLLRSYFVCPACGMDAWEDSPCHAPLSNGNSTEQKNVEKANLQGEIGGQQGD